MLLITSDGQCAPRRTRVTATDNTPAPNTAKPARSNARLRVHPEQERDKAEDHHGMNDVAAGKRTQARIYRRVGGPGSIDDGLEHNVGRERRCDQGTERECGSATPTPQSRNGHSTERNRESRRAELGSCGFRVSPSVVARRSLRSMD